MSSTKKTQGSKSFSTSVLEFFDDTTIESFVFGAGFFRSTHEKEIKIPKAHNKGKHEYKIKIEQEL